MGDAFMKTKEVIFLLNKMHEEVKALIIEEQTRNLLDKLSSKAIDK